MSSRATAAGPAAVIALRTAIQQQRDAIAALADRAKELRATAVESQEEFDALLARQQDRHLQAILAGDPMPADDPKEGALLRELQAKKTASSAAAEVLDGDKKALEAELPRLHRDLADAFLLWKSDGVSSAIQTAKQTLGRLQGPLVEILAFEALQQDLLGRSFQTGRAVDPKALASGTALVGAFLDNLPTRLAANELSPDALDAATAAVLKSLKKEIHA